MKQILFISLLISFSCYGMENFNNHYENFQNTNQYQMATLNTDNILNPNDEINAMINLPQPAETVNQNVQQQAITRPNINDDDTSDDDTVNQWYTNQMEEEEDEYYDDYEEDRGDHHYDTHSTPSEIDYPTTPTSEETSTPSYLMSED